MMLDSYFEEVRKKRRKNLIFWILVFIFAIGLYFFFQGKYISINIGSQNIFSQNIDSLSEKTSTGVLETEKTSENPIFSLHSFGIVNVKVFPRDSHIFLNDKPYINDSKPRVDYGKYTLKMNHDDYISGEMNFEISDEKAFYIDDVVLLKRPEYSVFSSLSDSRIMAVGQDQWISYSGSGMVFYKNDFLTGSQISLKNFPFLGEHKFYSGQSVMEYSLAKSEWIPETNIRVNNFVKNCENSISYRHALYFCGENNTLMTESGKTLTGVVHFGKNFIQYAENVSVGDVAHGHGENFSLTGATLSGAILGKNFIKISDEWYNISENGEFLPLNEKNILKNPLPTLEMQNIEFADKVGEAYFFIGNTENGKKLAVLTLVKNIPKIRYLDFPNREIADVRIYEKNRNYFIKSHNFLLFFYRESEQLEWLIDGKILTIGKDFALYEKENTIWRADWKDENLTK